MRRRDFLKTGTLVARLASSPHLMMPLVAEESGPRKTALSQRHAEKVPEEIRTAEYLRRGKSSKFLSKLAVMRKIEGSAGLSVSPMLLAERRTCSVDLTVTSSRKQDVTLIEHYSIEEINASAAVLPTPLKRGTANCNLHLPKGKAVVIRLKLRSHKPNEWGAQISKA